VKIIADRVKFELIKSGGATFMLNSKQVRFVDEYCISHSAADAARKAGYSVKTAYAIGAENLRKPQIKAAIQARQAATALELGVTRKKLISELLEAIRTARAQGDPMGMIAGAREVGKMLGLYAPEEKKIDLTVNQQCLRSQFDGMSDDELSAIIDGECAAV
jgi:phage terminase small subunit